MLIVPLIIGAILLPLTNQSSLKDTHVQRDSLYHGKGQPPASIVSHHFPGAREDYKPSASHPDTHGDPRLTPDPNKAPHIQSAKDAFQDSSSIVSEQDPPASPQTVTGPSRRKLHARRSPNLRKSSSALGSSPSRPNASPKLPELHLTYVHHTTSTNDTNSNATKPAPTSPDDFLKHITTVAHVSNGITLQAGLMNGPIPIEEVVDELFNLGSAKVADLMKFKEDKITALVSKLKEVRQGVAAKAETTPMENRAFQWEEYRRRSESFGNVTNLPGSMEYFKAVDDFKKDFDFTLLQSCMNELAGLNKRISDILETNYELKSNQLLGVGALKTFSAMFQSVKAALAKVEQVDKTSSFNSLINGPTTFNTITTMIELNVLRPQYTILHSEDGENLIKSNIEQVLKSYAARQASENDMMTVLKFSDRHVMRPQKKFTSGFPLGFEEMEQLGEDVESQWFLKIANSTDLDKRSIINSLRPIIAAAEALGPVNKKLMSTFPAASAQQRQMFTKFKDESYLVPTEAISATTVLGKYRDCYAKPNTEDERKPGRAFMAKVKSVGDSLTALDKFFQTLDLDQLEKDVAEFVNSLNFTDINNQTQSEAELVEVVKDIKNSGKLVKIQESVKNIQQMINGADLKTLNETLLPNLNNNFMEDRKFKEVISAETKVSECLQNLTADSLLVTQAITTIRKLRNLDEKLLETIQQTATSVAQFSATLASVKKIPDTMKKNVKNVTLELNKRSQFLNQSDAISHSASALRGVFGLVKLESSIDQLKDADAIVSDEIAKIQATEDQEKLKTQWGNHKTDMASLDAAIVQAKAFVKKIDVSKAQTLANYSAPLKDLAAIPDVKINAFEKSKVLEILISLMPPAGRRRRVAADPKTQLLAAKTVLDQLAALDLHFSAGASDIPSAFNSFNNFLTKVFATQHVRAPSSSSGNSGGTGGKGTGGGGTGSGTGGGSGSGAADGMTSGGSSLPTNMSKEPAEFPIIAVVIPIVIMLFAGIAIGGAFYWRKQKEEEKKRAEAEEKRRKRAEQEAEEKRKDQEKIDKLAAEVKEREEKSLARHRKEEEEEKQEKLLNEERAKEQKAKVIEAIKAWIISQDHKEADIARFYNATLEQVYAMTFDEENAAKSMNTVEVMVNGKRAPIYANWIPTHGHPHRFIATQGPLDNTRKDFWAMCMQHNVDKIVMLCQNVENKVSKCEEYFAPAPPSKLDIGRFQITTQSRKLILNGNVIERKLLAKDTTGKLESRTLTHYQHVKWPDRKTPKTHVDTFQLMEMVKKSENPIVVHCSAEIGRSTAFIGTEYLAREVENDPTIELTEALKHLREHCWKGILTRSQLYWMTLGAVYRLIKEYKFDMKIYKDQMAHFEAVIAQLFKYEKVMQPLAEHIALGKQFPPKKTKPMDKKMETDKTAEK